MDPLAVLAHGAEQAPPLIGIGKVIENDTIRYIIYDFLSGRHKYSSIWYHFRGI